MSSRASATRRLLRKGPDAERTLGPELSADFKEPSRSSGQLPRRYRVEEGRCGQDTEGDPIQAPPFSQHQTFACEPPQRLRRASNGCFRRLSKEAQVRELGESIKQLEIEGNHFGYFSLSVVIYDLDPAKVDTACAEFYKVFSVHDAQLGPLNYNLLNAFLAAVPGGTAFNFRSMYLLNTNYADYSFLFPPHSGELENSHLRQEYLAVLEPTTTHPTS